MRHGQTKGVTLGLQPVSGVSELDEYNSAFGRLAVACTRASHGLSLGPELGWTNSEPRLPGVTRNPFGEPGTRTLHRRTMPAFWPRWPGSARGPVRAGKDASL